jgi:heme-degrading monooxygenase HmoA
MIVRAWRGRASRLNREAYPRHFRENVLPELQRSEGFLGAMLLAREEANDVEYLVQTQWTSIDAIREFAGDDAGRAVVEAGAKAALISFDATVTHYELVDEAGPTPTTTATY